MERGGDDDPRVALHVPGRRQVADLDRLAEDVLSGSQRRSLHLFYRFGPAFGFRRCGRRRSAARLFADFLFRRSERPAVFLQAVSGRSLHRDRDDRARPGHDAAQPELPQLPRFAEEHRDQRRVAAVCHPALSRSRRAALPLCREERHPDAGAQRRTVPDDCDRRLLPCGGRRAVRDRARFVGLFGGGFGADGVDHVVHGRHPALYRALRRGAHRPRPQTGARRHGCDDGRGDSRFRTAQRHERDRRRLYAGQLYLRPDSRVVRFRHLYPSERARPLDSVGSRAVAGAVLCVAAQFGTLVRWLLVQL